MMGCSTSVSTKSTSEWTKMHNGDNTYHTTYITSSKSNVTSNKSNGTSNKSNGTSHIVIPSAQQLQLTAKQKKLIRSTWKRLKSKQVLLGMSIFYKIFQTEPHLAKLFGFVDVMTADRASFSSHPSFVAHATNFITGIDGAVENMDVLDQGYSGVLLNLGKRHARFSSDMTSTVFNVFLHAIFEVLSEELKGHFTPEVADAWRALFYYITDKLKEGYNTSCPQISEKLTNIISDNNE